MSKIKVILGAFLCLSLFIACDNEDDNNDNSGGVDVSQEMTFEISGAINGNKNGQARVLYVSSLNSNIRYLDGNDGPAITGPEQTFSIDFSTLNTNGEVPQFTEGTYLLSDDNLTDSENYAVSYSVIDENFNEVDYFGGFNEHSGQLTITNISNNRMQGTFNFTAENEAGETINVTNGQFNARILE